MKLEKKECRLPAFSIQGILIFGLFPACVALVLTCSSFAETKDLIPVKEIVIPLYKAYYVPSPPMPVKMVSVANPGIADVKVITPKDILIEARGLGVTTVFLWFVEHDDDWMLTGRPICMKFNVKITMGLEVETIKGTAVCPACSLGEYQYEKTGEKRYMGEPEGNNSLIGRDSGNVEIIK